MHVILCLGVIVAFGARASTAPAPRARGTAQDPNTARAPRRGTARSPPRRALGGFAAVFVDIPQAGGRDVAQRAAACGALEIPPAARGRMTASAAQNHGHGADALAVVREPEDRFRESFFLWRYAVQDGAGRAKDSPATKLPTLGAFVDAARDERDARHELALDALGRRHAGDVSFGPQSAWLNGEKNRTAVVCNGGGGLRAPDQLAARFERALRERYGVSCDLRAKRGDEAPAPLGAELRSREHRLSSAQRAWLRARYSDDFALWDARCRDAARDGVAATLDDEDGRGGAAGGGLIALLVMVAFCALKQLSAYLGLSFFQGFFRGFSAEHRARGGYHSP